MTAAGALDHDSITRGGIAGAVHDETRKGIEYALFDATERCVHGDVHARHDAPPVIVRRHGDAGCERDGDDHVDHRRAVDSPRRLRDQRRLALDQLGVGRRW